MDFFFADNQTVDSIEVVPADFRPFYIDAGEGKFKLDEKFKQPTAALDGLNKTNKSLRGAEKTYKDQVTKWTALGATPDEVQAMLTDLNEKIAAGSKINPEKIKEEITKGFEAKLKEKDTELEGMTGSLRKYLIDAQATSAIAANKGVPELLLPHIQSQVRVVKEANGEFRTVVVDANGDTRYSSTGSPMTIAELVTNMKTDKIFGRAFESEAGGGSDTDPKGTSKPVKQQKGDAELSANDKIAAGLAARRK